ncbi:MAG: tetratricopeptide repeat protein [Verrucomicrobiae bacterium]|nr:tetratricopeptide repeat protein [Verrucomicrobiae bacterium]
MSDHLSRGRLLRQQNRHEEAEAFLRQAIAIEPNDVLAYTELAQCLAEQSGRRRDALETIDRAIALEPDDAFLHSQRALILSRLDRDRESLISSERAIALDPECSTHFAVKGQALTGLQRYAEAEEACRKALALDADDHLAANLLAHLLRVQGKSAESELAADKLLAEDPEDPYAHFNAGWTALQRNDHRAAEGHFREALRLDAGFEPARGGLLESFKARSAFYRLYLRWCFWMQRFTSKAQWAIIVGFLVLYNFGRKLLGAIHPLAGVAVVVIYLGFVLWVWLAPGLGNLLILSDRSARHALGSGERWQGIVAGGGLIIGAMILALSGMWHYAPGYVFGGTLICAAIPAALTFGNESSKGRLVFGSLLALIYVIGFGVGTAEAFRYPAEGFSSRSGQLIVFGLIAGAICTWLGNVSSLREERPS